MYAFIVLTFINVFTREGWGEAFPHPNPLHVERGRAGCGVNAYPAYKNVQIQQTALCFVGLKA